MAINRTSADPAMDQIIAQVIRAIPAQSQAAARKNIPLIVRALKDEGILTPNVLSYALATIQHESGSFEPVNEGYYLDKGKAPGTSGKQIAAKNGYSGGANYYGRGFIQLTHDYNYKKIGNEIGLGDKLVNNPDLANDPEIAAKIFARFLKNSGTAATADKGDFFNARAGVNSKDYRTYQPIANTAKKYKGTFTQEDVESLIKQGYQYIGEDAYYKRDKTKSNGYDLIRTGITPSPTPDVKDYRFVADPLGDAMGGISSATQKIMRSVAPPAYASELPGMDRKYTKEYAQQYYSPYTVKAGDTLWAIAERTLGSGNKYKELGYKGNPRQLQPGTVLKVPTPSRPAPAPIMQSRPNTTTVGMSTPQGPREISISSSGSMPMPRSVAPVQSIPRSVAPAPIRSTPAPVPRTVAPIQSKPATAKPVQSTAGGGNVISKLVNAVTNLFKQK
ncbi:MAG: glycoside hydrolase family 19 protein [Patescibacteria group bacterium]